MGGGGVSGGDGTALGVSASTLTGAIAAAMYLNYTVRVFPDLSLLNTAQNLGICLVGAGIAAIGRLRARDRPRALLALRVYSLCIPVLSSAAAFDAYAAGTSQVRVRAPSSLARSLTCACQAQTQHPLVPQAPLLGVIVDTFVLWLGEERPISCLGVWGCKLVHLWRADSRSLALPPPRPTPAPTPLCSVPSGVRRFWGVVHASPSHAERAAVGIRRHARPRRWLLPSPGEAGWRRVNGGWLAGGAALCCGARTHAQAVRWVVARCRCWSRR